MSPQPYAWPNLKSSALNRERCNACFFNCWFSKVTLLLTWGCPYAQMFQLSKTNPFYLRAPKTFITQIAKNASSSPALPNLWLLNNYWMKLSMISWIIKTEVCVIWRSPRLRQITQTWGFDNSCYHAKTEFNNCFIIHFSHNSHSETEEKRSAILFLRRTLQGA